MISSLFPRINGAMPAAVPTVMVRSFDDLPRRLNVVGVDKMYVYVAHEVAGSSIGVSPESVYEFDENLMQEILALLDAGDRQSAATAWQRAKHFRVGVSGS